MLHFLREKVAIAPVFVSVPFINKDASSDSSLRKVCMKYLCWPHKVIPLKKHRDFLKQKHVQIKNVLFYPPQIQTKRCFCVAPFPKHRTKPDVLAERICTETKSWATEADRRRICRPHRNNPPLRDLVGTPETSSLVGSARSYEETGHSALMSSTKRERHGRHSRLIWVCVQCKLATEPVLIKYKPWYPVIMNFLFTGPH